MALLIIPPNLDNRSAMQLVYQTLQNLDRYDPLTVKTSEQVISFLRLLRWHKFLTIGLSRAERRKEARKDGRRNSVRVKEWV